MRLLVITQKVDRSDPILGFFHGWLRQMGVTSRGVTVIGQYIGNYELPNTVTVRTLGKENGVPRWKQILRFYGLLWKHRGEYDAVFVHMTPVWVVLGGPLWLLAGKKTYLWYEARGGGLMLRIALLFVHKVFSASAKGLPVPSKKSVIVGHGIDTDQFKPGPAHRDGHLLLTVGRITRSKNLPMILQTLSDLGSNYRLRIAGAPITPDDEKLLWELQQHAEKLGIPRRLQIAAVPPDELPQILNGCALFLHASATALDKALLEAMACGCLVVSSADVAATVLPPQCVATPDTLVNTAKTLLELPASQADALRKELRKRVEEGHSLPRLIERLKIEMA